MKLLAVFILVVSVSAAVYGETTETQTTQAVETQPDETTTVKKDETTSVKNDEISQSTVHVDVSDTTEHDHGTEPTTVDDRGAAVSIHCWSVVTMVAVAFSLRLIV